MYLMSWIEEEAKIEASLGGRVTKEEMWVFAEELKEVAGSMDQAYLVVLDYSRAKHLEPSAADVLAHLKDYCHENGAAKVVTIAKDEADIVAHTQDRLQLVLEGREEYVLDASTVQWVAAAAAEGLRMAM
jgi:anti-anti-sigma regulatory factor